MLTAGLGLILCIVGVSMGAIPSEIRRVYGSDLYQWGNRWRFTDDGDNDWNNDWDDDWDDDRDEDYYKGSDTEQSQGSSVQGEKKYVQEFKNIRSLDIEVAYAEVEVKKIQGDVVTVDTSKLNSKRRDALLVNTEEGELKLESRGSDFWLKINETKDAGRIVIGIPQDARYEEASFDVGAGRLQIEDISAGSLKINVGGGEAVIGRFQADELDAECGAGKMTFNGIVNRDADVSCGVGEVKLNLTDSQDNYNYELECGIGRLKVGNDSYTGLGSSRSIDNGANKKVEISCSVGKVEVTFGGN